MVRRVWKIVHLSGQVEYGDFGRGSSWHGRAEAYSEARNEVSKTTHRQVFQHKGVMFRASAGAKEWGWRGQV